MVRSGGYGKFGKFGKKGKHRRGRLLFSGSQQRRPVVHLTVLPIIYHPCQIYHSNHSLPKNGKKENRAICYITQCHYFISLYIPPLSYHIYQVCREGGVGLAKMELQTGKECLLTKREQPNDWQRWQK
jgi:hypothetical protein